LQNQEETIPQKFTWKEGFEKCTEGIWLSSKPYVLNTFDKKEVKIML